MSIKFLVSFGGGGGGDLGFFGGGGSADFILGGSFLLTARSFLLTVGLCYLRWSFLLTVKIWFGLFYLRLNYGLVFFAYGGKSVWSFLLTVLLVQGIGFGLFYLRFPYRK